MIYINNDHIPIMNHHYNRKLLKEDRSCAPKPPFWEKYSKKKEKKSLLLYVTNMKKTGLLNVCSFTLWELKTWPSHINKERKREKKKDSKTSIKNCHKFIVFIGKSTKPKRKTAVFCIV